jgi:hypothetical protein
MAPTLKRYLVLLLLPFLLSGCLDYTERIIIGRDGSATIQLKLRVANAIQSLIAKNLAFHSLAVMTDGKALQESLPHGLSLRKHQEIPSGGRQTYLNELFAPDARAIQTGDSAVFKGQEFSVVKLSDGSLKYHRKLDFTSAMRDPELSQMIAQNKFGIVGILKGAPFTFQLATPLKVLSTNGTLEDGVVSWSYMLYDLLQNPVEQDVVLAPPTKLDMAIGAVTTLFQPRIFPFLALLLLSLFFIFTRIPANKTAA